MHLRPSTAKVQHGFDAVSPQPGESLKPQSENLVLNVRNQSSPGKTHQVSVTKHLPSLIKRTENTTLRRSKVSPSRLRWTNTLEATTMTTAKLEAFLGAGTLRRLHIPSIHLTYLWSANVDPPVTARSLGELDLVRIINDAKLRHDLNFELEISFRPNIYGPRSQQKEAIANAYWEALTIEFALYIKIRHNIISNASSVFTRTPLPWISECATSPQLPLRLPQMFMTIRDILKTLVPGSECSAVDQRLDVDLIMQELENGVCDVKELSDWLRQLLLGSCSPLRDAEVERMVNTVHEGVNKDDARLLVDGLKVLFGILETMKLDVANHQIRYLRLLMVEDSINFEQNTFLRRIAEGFDVREARDWFEGSIEDQADGYMNLTRGVWDMVVDSRIEFPATFCQDTDRLLALQHEFRMEIYPGACAQAFIDTLRRLGWTGEPPHEAYNRMLTRVVDILKDGQRRFSIQDYHRNVALEVVREAYRLCNSTTLPNERLVGLARLYLEQSLEPTCSVHQRLHAQLSSQLADLMDAEVEVLIDLNPLQMLNYLHPGPLNAELKKTYGILNIAKRAAHIAVLHWKIWGPILYEQPRQTLNDPLEFPESSGVLAVAGLVQDTSPKVIHDGPLRQASRTSSTTTTVESELLRSRSATDTSSEQG